jgi:hypothetical protein
MSDQKSQTESKPVEITKESWGPEPIGEIVYLGHPPMPFRVGEEFNYRGSLRRVVQTVDGKVSIISLPFPIRGQPTLEQLQASRQK